MTPAKTTLKWTIKTLQGKTNMHDQIVEMISEKRKKKHDES